MSRRVIVWGTGNVGKAALRTVAADPALELVGVIVSNPEKVGRDAGALAELPYALGVTATDDVAAALARGADAVAYCASGDFRPDAALADVERCLRAGCSVVSTALYPLYDPTSAPEDLRRRMEDACRAGKASLFVSGIDPGFINDVVPILVSGLCQEIDEIRAFEIFNYELYAQPDAVRHLVGFGQPLDGVPPMVAPGVPTMVWGGQIRLLARGLGLALDEIREVVERRPLARDVTNRLGLFAAGTQGALRFEVQGWIAGEPRIVIEHVTRITDDPALDPAGDWPRVDGGSAHGVRITGRPSLTLTIEAEDEHGDRAGGGNATAACRIVRAIPFVCAAEPGLLDALAVPLAPGRGVFRTR
jgi:hypothetical protein